ncbi:DUF6934 family protein [Dyadobacter sp. CY347]|uniref:DUF6934 family protein n=1 Tax=Dyadobacter sp. CY347 TaxID=2909336 RepID=UPI001F3C36B1|nr:hypothetical protein [Dyadobacter sp. CY347]MCF2490167.1 hypothetical protein [Dyadobacter sp. CY347]
MKHNFYPIEASTDYLRFTFESRSASKRIRIHVQFLLIDENVYNLAFGDIDKYGELDDLSVSDNQDMELVLATVIQTVFSFLELNPDKKVFFQGSTPSRTRLYQIVITREKQHWDDQYVVEGIINEISEAFQPGKNYEAFLINLKHRI